MNNKNNIAACDKTRNYVDHALTYAERGWHVFPLWPLRGKQCGCGKADCGKNAGRHPIGLLVPNGFKDATTDEATIKQWWRRYPNAGIGVATGKKRACL